MQWTKKSENKNVIIYYVTSESRLKLTNFVIKSKPESFGMCGIIYIDTEGDLYGEADDTERYYGTSKSQLKYIRQRLDLAKKALPKSCIITGYFCEYIYKK